LPHTGDLIHSNVIAEAARLNQGIVVLNGYRLKDDPMPVRLTGEGVSLEVIKKAEKESCLVVRLVETLGRHTIARLEPTDPATRVVETDLMEWNDGPTLSGASLELQLKPFEIRTYKLRQ
jgi:alpha-mannosidase